LTKAHNESLLRESIKQAKELQSADATTFCATCQKPTVCLSATEKRIEGELVTAQALFVCADEHLTSCTDTRNSLIQECHCDIQVKPVKSPLTPEQERGYRQAVSRTQRVLIVTGFHNINAETSNYITKLLPRLEAHGIPYDIVIAQNEDMFFIDTLESGRYQSLLLVHLDHNGMRTKGDMFGMRGLGTLFNWIRFGGKFLLHGEGDEVAWLLQTLVQKPWHFCGDSYRRCRHSCHADRFTVFSLKKPIIAVGEGSGDYSASVEATPNQGINSDSEGKGEEEGQCIVPSNINMKATMLSGVAPGDQLYSPKPGTRCISGVPGFGGHVVSTARTGIAASTLFEGLVVYIGDVNAEDKTVDVIVAIIEVRN
jgi:hypothetical protein